MPENEHEFVIVLTVRYTGPELGLEDKEGVKDAAVQTAITTLPDVVQNNGTDGVLPSG